MTYTMTTTTQHSKQYLIRTELTNGRIAETYASGELDANDPEDRPQDAAIRTVMAARRTLGLPGGFTTAVLDHTGRLVTRSV